MTEPTATPHASSDGLWRWLVGGLAAGGIMLGLLIAAYAIGYHHGQHHARSAVPPPAGAARTTPTPTGTASSPTTGTVPATAALVTRGRSLYQGDGCSGCHSLTGSPGAGPSFKGLAGSGVDLATGKSVTADDAYLERSIANPDAQIVKGYRSGIMAAAIAGFHLAGKPGDIRALVAFIKSQK